MVFHEFVVGVILLNDGLGVKGWDKGDGGVLLQDVPAAP